MTAVNITASGSNPTTAFGRWVSAALAAQTISGTLKGVVSCQETNGNYNGVVAVAAKVIKPDGTDRGVLLAVTASDAAGTPPEMRVVASGYQSRRFQDTAEATDLTLTSVDVTAGDYLVIEVGTQEAATVGSLEGFIKFGDNAAADLDHSDTDTGEDNPWIEFTDDITFYTAPTLPQQAILL
jgi:hypothetical protein